MSNNIEILKLLGEENIEKLKKDICKIILKTYENDLNNNYDFACDNSIINQVIDEAIEESKEILKQKIIEIFCKRGIEQLDKYLNTIENNKKEN